MSKWALAGVVLALSATSVAAQTAISDCAFQVFEQLRSIPADGQRTCGFYFDQATITQSTPGTEDRYLVELEVVVRQPASAAIAKTCTGLDFRDLQAGQSFGFRQVVQLERFGNQLICDAQRAGPLIDAWLVYDPMKEPDGTPLLPDQLNAVIAGYWTYQQQDSRTSWTVIMRFVPVENSNTGTLTIVGENDAGETPPPNQMTYTLVSPAQMRLSLPGEAGTEAMDFVVTAGREGMYLVTTPAGGGMSSQPMGRADQLDLAAEFQRISAAANR